MKMLAGKKRLDRVTLHLLRTVPASQLHKWVWIINKAYKHWK